MTLPAEPQRQTAPRVEWRRDAEGTLYALEVIDAERWDPAWTLPPAPETADARVVRLPAGAEVPASAILPAWLAVDLRPHPVHPHSLHAYAGPYAGDGSPGAPARGVAERSPTYRVHSGSSAAPDTARDTAANPPSQATADALPAEAAPAPDADLHLVDGVDGVDGEALWLGSPYYRGPAPTRAAFLAAARAALDARAASTLGTSPLGTSPLGASPPGASPPGSPSTGAPFGRAGGDAETLRRLSAFARGRPAPLGQLALLAGDACERWLQFAFGAPERLYDEIVLARLADAGEAAFVACYRALAAARLPDTDAAATDAASAQWRELAVDQRALLEQLAPARAIAGGLPRRALSAARDWLARYRGAHERHLAEQVGPVRGHLHVMEQQRAAVRCLARLNAIAALGPPVGAAEVARWEALAAELRAFPTPADREPDSGRVVPGRPPRILTEARAVTARVADAFEEQRARLAAAIARRILGRHDVPALDRLVQAIQVSDIDALHRVLDDRLAALLDRMLGERPASLLDELADRYPEVAPGEVDRAVAVFRGLLEVALAAAPGVPVRLAPTDRSAAPSVGAPTPPGATPVAGGAARHGEAMREPASRWDRSPPEHPRP